MHSPRDGNEETFTLLLKPHSFNGTKFRVFAFFLLVMQTNQLNQSPEIKSVMLWSGIALLTFIGSILFYFMDNAIWVLLILICVVAVIKWLRATGREQKRITEEAAKKAEEAARQKAIEDSL
jgi:chromate transport protein ChrA